MCIIAQNLTYLEVLMDNQTTEIYTVENPAENTEAKKPLSKNLIWAIAAISLAVGGVLVHAAMTFVVPFIYYAIDLVLTVLGLIPIIGIPFNLLSLLLSFVYGFITFFNPLVWVLCFGAVIGGIVVGVISLIKILSKPEDGNGTLEKLLSIGAIVLGALAIFVMIFMLIVSIVMTMINIAISIVGIALDIVSFFIG